MRKVKGIRKINDLPWDQRHTLREIVSRIKDKEYDYLIDIFPTPYCGPGTLGDKGAYTISLNGMIYSYVLPNGIEC